MGELIIDFCYSVTTVNRVCIGAKLQDSPVAPAYGC